MWRKKANGNMSDAPDTVIRKVFGNAAIHQISGSGGSRKEQVVKNVQLCPKHIFYFGWFNSVGYIL